MKYILAFLCLFTPMVVSMEYYGFTPSSDIKGLLQGHANTLSSIGGHDITHVISSHNRTGKDLDDFFTNTLVNNITLYDIMHPSMDHEDLQKRETKVACSASKVIDKLGKDTVDNICSVMGGLASSAPAGIALVINGRGCTASADGHATFCNVVVTMTGAASTGITFDRVKTYCPRLLGAFVKCDGTNASGNGDGKVSMTKQVSQTTKDCSNYHSKCKTITQSDNR